MSFKGYGTLDTGYSRKIGVRLCSTDTKFDRFIQKKHCNSCILLHLISRCSSCYHKLTTWERIRHTVSLHRRINEIEKNWSICCKNARKHVLFEIFYSLLSLQLPTLLLVYVWLTYCPYQFCLLFRNLWVPIQSQIRSNPCISRYLPVVCVENESKIS